MLHFVVFYDLQFLVKLRWHIYWGVTEMMAIKTGPCSHSPLIHIDILGYEAEGHSLSLSLSKEYMTLKATCYVWNALFTFWRVRGLSKVIFYIKIKNKNRALACGYVFHGFFIALWPWPCWTGKNGKNSVRFAPSQCCDCCTCVQSL